MQTIQRKNIKDIAPYDGPYKIPGIRFRAVREALVLGAGSSCRVFFGE